MKIPAKYRLYGDKELLTFMGYNTYDYSARHYYAAASSFDTPDPMAGEKTWISPYSFCSGDPVNRVDPSGMTDFVDNDGNVIGNDGDPNGKVRVMLTTEKEFEDDSNKVKVPVLMKNCLSERSNQLRRILGIKNILVKILMRTI